MNLSFVFILFTLFFCLQACISKPQRIVRKEFRHEKNEILIEGFYSSTISQMTIHFFDDYRFYIRSTSVFYSEWESGSWTKNGDTLSLTYDTHIWNGIGGKIIVMKKYLAVQKKVNDTLMYSPTFRIVPLEMGRRIKYDTY